MDFFTRAMEIYYEYALRHIIGDERREAMVI